MPRNRTRALTRILAVLGALMWFSALLPGTVQSADAAQQKRRSVAKSTTARSKSRTTTVKKATRRQNSSTIRRATASRYSRSRAAARRASLIRARQLRAQRELQELQTPRYKVDGTGSVVPDIRAEAAIIYNPVTHEVLWAENENSERSIASITKVMTAVVFLENEYDLARVVTIDRGDLRGASVTYLRAGEQLTVDDLLHLLLVASDNGAARTLARGSVFGYDGFIERMNEKARELGLEHTHYADPSGLDARNVSSAYDMARLIAFAAADERIAPIMRKQTHSFATSRRTINVHNTNRLVGSEIDVRGGKTGFISKAGYCLATLLKLPQSNDQVAVVVLGARSNAARFWETRHLLNWLASKTSQLVTATSIQEQQQ